MRAFPVVDGQARANDLGLPSRFRSVDFERHLERWTTPLHGCSRAGPGVPGRARAGPRTAGQRVAMRKGPRC